MRIATRSRAQRARVASLQREVGVKREQLSEQRKKLDQEMRRAFGLLRKVLRERPDRVRLWTRAIQMCRQTGVKGLSEILEDIQNVLKENRLAAEYLTANTLALSGAQVMIAARILSDQDAAELRKRAARSFLEDICSTRIDPPPNQQHRWLLRVSWEQYCFGIYCAHFIIKKSEESQSAHGLTFSNALLKAGEACLTQLEAEHHPAGWAPYYEAHRRTLYSHDGKGLFTAQVIQLPIEGIEEARMGKTGSTNEWKKIQEFKDSSGIEQSFTPRTRN